jgi:hypothetical protein
MANVKQQLDIPAIPSLGASGVNYSQNVQNQNNGLLRLFFTKLANVVQSVIGPMGGKYLNNPYGAFQSLSDQTAAAANTAYAITFDTTNYSNGIVIESSSRLKVSNAGIYNFQWSGQFQNTDILFQSVNIWLRKNGTDIAGSLGSESVPYLSGAVNGTSIIGRSYFIELNVDDYIELYWSTTSTNVSLQFYATQTSPTRPTTASVIGTMNFVSNLPTL